MVSYTDTSLNEFTTDARYVIREFCIIGKEGRLRTTIVWVKMIWAPDPLPGKERGEDRHMVIYLCIQVP